MSAETLRRAAALMRERAEAATPGPWATDSMNTTVHSTGLDWQPVVVETFVSVSDEFDADLPHIASWHPAVALAVANWLDHEADRIDHPQLVDVTPGEVRRSLAVARAYLGESA